jgi:hypothetical protein
MIGLTVAQWLEGHLQRHLCYERRRDRKNFYELLAIVLYPLT